MNFADEIEQINKEAADKAQKDHERLVKENQLRKEAKDKVFAQYYEEINRQDQFFIEKIKTLEILNIFNELIEYGNLVFVYKKEYVTKQVSTFFTSKTVTESVWKAIPARISISRDKQKGIYDGARLIASKDQKGNWNISLSDFHQWTSYAYAWKDYCSPENVENQLKSLKMEPLLRMSVTLQWDFESPDPDFSSSGTFEQLSVEVSKDFVNVSGILAPLDTCTPQWIKHEVARVYTSYLSRKNRG